MREILAARNFIPPVGPAQTAVLYLVYIGNTGKTMHKTIQVCGFFGTFGSELGSESAAFLSGGTYVAGSARQTAA